MAEQHSLRDGTDRQAAAGRISTLTCWSTHPGLIAQWDLWFPTSTSLARCGQTRRPTQLLAPTMMIGYLRWLSTLPIPVACRVATADECRGPQATTIFDSPLKVLGTSELPTGSIV
jgi:hypothetical protein